MNPECQQHWASRGFITLGSGQILWAIVAGRVDQQIADGGWKLCQLGTLHSQESEDNVGVAVGRMKGAKGGGSRLKHDNPSAMSRVAFSLT